MTTHSHIMALTVQATLYQATATQSTLYQTQVKIDFLVRKSKLPVRV